MGMSGAAFAGLAVVVLLVALVIAVVTAVVILRVLGPRLRAPEPPVTPDGHTASPTRPVPATEADGRTAPTQSPPDGGSATGGGSAAGGGSAIGGGSVPVHGTAANDTVPVEATAGGPASALTAVSDTRTPTAPRTATAAPAPRAAPDGEDLDASALAVVRGQARRVVEAAQEEATEILNRTRRRAEREAEELLAGARRGAERDVAGLKADAIARRDEAQRRELRVAEREERAGQTEGRLAEREAELAALAEELTTQKQTLAAAADTRRAELERIAGLSAAAARTELIKTVETQAKREAAVLVRDIEAEARAKGEERAKRIVVDAIQRVAGEQTAESVVSVLHLPGDEMKGRIIGREGRNIRTFEAVTGVNLIIDDTPEAVLLSCFDPVRREVGRLTLEKLVLDGRIHPQRIEEIYERSKEQVEQLCVRAGEEALVQVGIADVHPELIATLGRLRYRTSYGQNVLKHLIETAHIAAHMAAELRLDVALVKRSAFLHDIGKALTHEVEGSHALIGADLARRLGESDEVVHAIEAHHDEVAPRTVEAVLTQASDACSGGRPGARRESLETYVKRLERIEEIAAGMPGVEKVFAMQAGREVRVMVAPDQVDDLTALVIARDVAKQIEDELTYPGQIRVTVVRESRALGVAR